MAEHWCHTRTFDPVEDCCPGCEENAERTRRIFVEALEKREKRNKAINRFVKGLRERHIEALEAAVSHGWVWSLPEEQTALGQLLEQLKKLHEGTRGKTGL
jgi:hypothetical protein